MQKLEKRTIGVAVTASCCTWEKIESVFEKLKEKYERVIPIFSERTATMDNRFTTAAKFVKKIQSITGEEGIFTIPEAEPIGPKGILDLLLIAPCTGNTLAKLSSGISDSTVLMAAKAHLRNEKPLLIAISTNDALGMNLKNIATLYNTKHIFFVPFGQDNPATKKNSMIADMTLIPQAVEAALQGEQLQPVIREFAAQS